MQFCGLRKICVVTLLEDLIYTQEFPSPLDQFRSTAVLGYRESERWIRIRIFCQDVLGYLVFFKLY